VGLRRMGLARLRRGGYQAPHNIPVKVEFYKERTKIGEIVLEDGQLRYDVPERIRSKGLDKLTVLEPGTGRLLTLEEPEAWLRALPIEFRTVYLRAVFSD
jgi:hypothetical protein